MCARIFAKGFRMSSNGNCVVVLRTFILIYLASFIQLTESKAQYVEPLAMGMKVSISYDIANTFQFPIAGTLGVVLSIILALIIFFGIITAPFGYFFGIPSRKYVLGGSSAPRSFDEGINLDFLNLNETIFKDPGKTEYSYPSFADSLFYLLPQKELSDFNCQLLLTCSVHSVLNYLPDWALRLYSLFSRSLGEMQPSFKSAIIKGISDGNSCANIYSACPDSVFSLVIKTFLNLLPDSVKNENFRKRKAAMYMNL